MLLQLTQPGTPQKSNFCLKVQSLSLARIWSGFGFFFFFPYDRHALYIFKDWKTAWQILKVAPMTPSWYLHPCVISPWVSVEPVIASNQQNMANGTESTRLCYIAHFAEDSLSFAGFEVAISYVRKAYMARNWGRSLANSSKKPMPSVWQPTKNWILPMTMWV